MKEKQLRVKEKVIRIAAELNELFDIRTQVKNELAEETRRDKDILDEYDTRVLEDVTREYKASLQKLQTVINESERLQMDNFGKSHEEIQAEIMRKTIYLELLKITAPDKYNHIINTYHLRNMMFETEAFERNVKLLGETNTSLGSQGFSPKQKNATFDQFFKIPEAEDYFKNLNESEIEKTTDYFIDYYKDLVLTYTFLQDDLINKVDLKTMLMTRVARLEKELEYSKQTEGVHLSKYQNSPIFPYLTRYESDLSDELDELVKDNHLKLYFTSQNNDTIMKAYSHLLLLFIKVTLMRKRAVPEGVKVDGDLNDFMSGEDLIINMNTSDTKILLGYTIYGNVQKFFPKEIPFKINLNESVVGVCLIRALWSGHITKAIEEIYFSDVNNQQPKRQPIHKYDRLMDKLFGWEDYYESVTSKDLLEWMLRNVSSV